LRPRTLIINLSQAASHDPELKSKIELAYIDYEGIRSQAVVAAREAIAARERASIAAAQATLKLLDFLKLAADIDSRVSTEAYWFPPYRNSNGEIILECPVTQRDQRTAMRVVRAMLHEQAKELDARGLFDEEEEEEN